VAETASHIFETSLEHTDGMGGRVSAAGKPTLEITCPPAFCEEQPDTVWSPEELFVASVEACVMTTFLLFARRVGMKIASYSSRAKGIVEVDGSSMTCTKIEISVNVGVPDARTQRNARALFKGAKKKCLLSNSVKSEIVCEAAFEVIAEAANE